VQAVIVVVDAAFVVVELVTVIVLVELTVVEAETDVGGVVEAELCSLALETPDATPDVVVTVEVVVTVDTLETVDEVATVIVVVEVIGDVPDGKLVLATSPSRTATMTAAPALAPTFPY
jgi:hypothetical protein